MFIFYKNILGGFVFWGCVSQTLRIVVMHCNLKGKKHSRVNLINNNKTQKPLQMLLQIFIMQPIKL